MPGAILGIILTAAALVLAVYLMNRSRCTLEQAVQLSGCSEQELRDLIREGWLTYRRQYVIFGPFSFGRSQLADVRAHYPELKRSRAEYDAPVRQGAEDLAAQQQEYKRLLEERNAAHQAEMERLRRIHAEMLRNVSIQLNLIPADVADALHVLGLQKDASFNEVYKRYRQLAKRHHPDTGGDPQHFMHINAAYDCVKKWIQSHG